ncbi:MAG: hypothetical protein C0407_06335 [Desulfobacca sp.]|nr:hypothetical protein [Desulfobacca sp.]
MLKKNHSIFFLGFLFLSLGCVSQVKPPLTPGTPEELLGCFASFPSEPWESVHKIEAVFRGGVSSTLLGITRGEPSLRRLQSVLLAPEGFTLFDGELREGEIQVRQALPPFDSPAFAKGLMEDVTLLFLTPSSRPASWGEASDGSRICRWEGPEGFRTEVWKSPDQGLRIRRWDDQGELIREVSLKGPFVQGLAANLELQVLRPISYKLKMTLIQSGP